MSLLLSEEQRQLQDSARSFLSTETPVSALRQLRDSGDSLGYDPRLWSRMVEMGWAAAIFPEECGGLNFGYKGLGQVFEQIGRTLAATPLLSSVVLGGELLLRAGTSEQQARWLQRMMSGDALLALALEESGRHRPQPISTRAERRNGNWVIDGEKWFVLDGHIADALIVVADTTDGVGLFMVDPAAPGISVERSSMVDSRNAARVRLNGVQVTDDALLGELGKGAAVLEAVLDRARACLAAEALGVICESFERTIEHLKQRVQFDVPIGTFQALQHRMARLYTEIELLRSCVMAALDAIDGGSSEAPVLACLAKGKASDLLEKSLNEAVQLHGGMGVTDELDIGLFLKRGRVISQTLGDGVFHRNRYANLKGF